MLLRLATTLFLIAAYVVSFGRTYTGSISIGNPSSDFQIVNDHIVAVLNELDDNTYELCFPNLNIYDNEGDTLSFGDVIVRDLVGCQLGAATHLCYDGAVSMGNADLQIQNFRVGLMARFTPTSLIVYAYVPFGTNGSCYLLFAQDPLKGDVNEDGEVSIPDISALVSLINSQ